MTAGPIPLEELLVRLARGDEAAARQFVAEYEPYIRRTIRPRLARANLRGGRLGRCLPVRPGDFLDPPGCR